MCRETERLAHDEHQRALPGRKQLQRHGEREVEALAQSMPPELPAGKVNSTDPDSRSIPIGFGFGFGFGFVQGYNAQAAVNEQQIVLAAEITNNSTDFSQLAPMVSATLDELQRAGID